MLFGVPMDSRRPGFLAFALLAVGLPAACSNVLSEEVEVEVHWNEAPARIDQVRIAGRAALLDAPAMTEAVFPVKLTLTKADASQGVHAVASYRGLDVADAYEAGGSARVVLRLASKTGLDAQRPCTADSDCATTRCGPKETFSESLWSCVSACGLATPSCPGGSDCDEELGVCVRGCSVDTDCHRQSGPFRPSAWTCAEGPNGAGRCVIKT